MLQPPSIEINRKNAQLTHDAIETMNDMIFVDESGTTRSRMIEGMKEGISELQQKHFRTKLQAA
jgi:hypothetical protein